VSDEEGWVISDGVLWTVKQTKKKKNARESGKATQFLAYKSAI